MRAIVNLNIWILFSITIILFGCVEHHSEEDLLTEFLLTESTDEMWSYAEKIKALDKEGIPIFLEVLSESLEDGYVLLKYARTNVCISSLHDLANREIYIIEEVPVLIQALQKQIYLPDTYLAAETLRLITGVDTGYSQKFIKSYTDSDEPVRQAKIAEWEKWWHNTKEKED